MPMRPRPRPLSHLFRRRATRFRENVAVAFAYLNANRHEQALQAAEEALRAQPGGALALVARSWALIGLDRYEEARPGLVEAVEAGEGEPWQGTALAGLAIADLVIGGDDLLSEAAAASEAAVRLLPRNPAFRGYRGLALVRAGRAEEGLALARQAYASMGPGIERADAACIAALALVRSTGRKGRREQAAAYLAEARSVLPGGSRILRLAEAAVTPEAA